MPSVLVSSLAMAVVTILTSGPCRYRTPRWVRRELSGALLNLGWRYDRERCLSSSSPPITSRITASWHTATLDGCLYTTFPSGNYRKDMEGLGFPIFLNWIFKPEKHTTLIIHVIIYNTWKRKNYKNDVFYTWIQCLSFINNSILIFWV